MVLFEPRGPILFRFEGLGGIHRLSACLRMAVLFLSRTIYCCRRIIVPPIEPVIFDHLDAFQTFSLRFAGDGASLKVPTASGGIVDEQRRCRGGWRHSIELRDV